MSQNHNPVNVAYIFEQDAANPDVQSGRPTSILSEFERAGFIVHRCFPMTVTTGLRERLERKLSRCLGKSYLAGRSNRQLRQMARQAEAELARVPYEFVFCPGTLPLAYLRTKKPVVFSSDATVRGITNYYPEFSQLSRFQEQNFERAERAALRKSKLLVYASEWAARSAIVDYKVPTERVAVLPSGANIGAENQPGDIERFLAARREDRIDLLFVGRAWCRKGGEICLETIRHLHARRQAVRLDVVGCQPLIPPDLSPHVRVHGPLKPSLPADRIRLEALFAQSHFLFVPSRAEAYGMVFCEANAFAVPCITTATGGIPTIVRNDRNGIALPLDAPAAEFADAIVRIASVPGRYAALARGSFDEFSSRLNWRIWMQGFLTRLDGVLAS